MKRPLSALLVSTFLPSTPALTTADPSFTGHGASAINAAPSSDANPRKIGNSWGASYQVNTRASTTW